MKIINLLTSLIIAISVTNICLATDQSIYEIIQKDRQFTTLSDHLRTQNLVETLNGETNYVFLAPTNKAFNAMPNLFRKALFADDNLLKEILMVHLLTSSNRLKLKTKAASSQGIEIAVDLYQSHFSVNDSRVIESNISAKNGSIYVIDRVIFPSEIRDRLPKIVGRPDNY